MSTILKIENLHKCYGQKEVLKGISLEVEKGEIISVLGPSGCGKSTLLNIIAGILPVDGGEVILNDRVVTCKGRMVPIEKRNINMVFQDFALWPHMGAAENILYGLRLRHESPEKQKKKLSEMTALLHLNGLMDQYPSQLSGGQQQRVAIARALINEPSVILLDEPLCNLDVQLRVEMRTEMAEIFHTLHTTVFHVTHDPSEAFAMADRIVIMNAGRIDQIASPQECYQKPASAVTAGLLGAGNQLPARYEREDLVSVDGCLLHVSVIGSHGKEITLRFRAEDCVFQRDPAEDVLPAEIVMSAFEGDFYRVIARIGSREVTFLSRTELSTGTKGYLSIKQDRLYAYGAEQV